MNDNIELIFKNLSNVETKITVNKNEPFESVNNILNKTDKAIKYIYRGKIIKQTELFNIVDDINKPIIYILTNKKLERNEQKKEEPTMKLNNMGFNLDLERARAIGIGTIMLLAQSNELKTMFNLNPQLLVMFLSSPKFDSFFEALMNNVKGKHFEEVLNNVASGTQDNIKVIELNQTDLINIDFIVSCGFTKDESINAYIKNNKDVNKTIDFLSKK